MSTRSEEPGINKSGLTAVPRGSEARRAFGGARLVAFGAQGQSGDVAPGRSGGSSRSFGAQWASWRPCRTRAHPPQRPLRAPPWPARCGARKLGVRGSEGQVRDAGLGCVSPRCELIIQMGCPGLGIGGPRSAPRYITSRPRHCGTCSPRGPHLLPLLLRSPRPPPRCQLPAAAGRSPLPASASSRQPECGAARRGRPYSGLGAASRAPRLQPPRPIVRPRHLPGRRVLSGAARREREREEEGPGRQQLFFF